MENKIIKITGILASIAFAIMFVYMAKNDMLNLISCMWYSFLIFSVFICSINMPNDEEEKNDE